LNENNGIDIENIKINLQRLRGPIDYLLETDSKVSIKFNEISHKSLIENGIRSKCYISWLKRDNLKFI
jgi:hypothetical protein